MNGVPVANPIRILTNNKLKLRSVSSRKKYKKMFNFFRFLKTTVYKNSYKDFHKFYSLNPDLIINLLTQEDPRVLEKEAEKMALGLFKQKYSSVPAYKKFLNGHGVNSNHIKDISKFRSLPTISKKNYLKKYPLDELTWNGGSEGLNLISVSSGSTGKPYFWPRGLGLEFETALEHELFLRYFFEIDKHKTLFIIGYAMGMYVAGVFTLNSLMNLVKKNYPLSIVSPGADKEAILSIIKKIGSQFDQIIVSAYSPVLKDLIDLGVEERVNWKKYNLKFISGGEGFSEEFRKYMYNKIGTKNYLKGSINTYGSADAAILGHETPLSILVRKIVSENSKLRKELFKDDRVPSLHQYYPFFKYFEEVGGNLILSTYGGVPLVRYSIGDVGGVIPFERMIKVLNSFGINITKEMAQYDCEDLILKLPFVYLFGRKDNTKIFYGANIYPEHIKNSLEQRGVIDTVTGKYFMDILFDKDYNQDLYLAVELAGSKKPTQLLKKKIASVIHENLLKVNDEYKYLSHTIGRRIYPTVKLFEYGNPKYFAPGIKPKYTKRV